MSTVDSTPKPQWEVTDELQKVSGPYTTTQLLQLATDGFLTSKSLVRHPQQTNGQWLEVMKIAKLASALEAKENRASNPFTTPPPAATLNSSRSSPSSHRFE